MCLKLISKKPRISNKERTAYKIFGYSGGRYEFMYRTFEGSDSVPMNTWVKAFRTKIVIRTGQSYLSGFHCYLSKTTALKVLKNLFGDHNGDHKIVKVRIRKVRTLGKESCLGKNINVIVADDMFVPKG